jgi:hypothetical protein
MSRHVHVSHRQSAIALTATALAVTLAACGSSSTAPNPNAPQSLAKHFDSIYAALEAKDTRGDSAVATYLADFIITPLAYGGQQANFTVTTDSGTQTWHGVVAEGAAVPPNSDSIYYIGVYSDPALTHALIAEIVYSSTGALKEAGAVAINNLDTLTAGGDSTFTGSGTLLSTGSACPGKQTGLASDSALSLWVGTLSCRVASLQISFQATFYGAANLGAAQSVSLTTVTFNGNQFYP